MGQLCFFPDAGQTKGLPKEMLEYTQVFSVRQKATSIWIGLLQPFPGSKRR
jgi:hypothetical protein